METGAFPGMASPPTHCLGNTRLRVLLHCQLKSRRCDGVHNSSYAPILNPVFNSAAGKQSCSLVFIPAGEEYDISEWQEKSKLEMFCHSFITIPGLRGLKTNPHTHLTSRSVISHSNCFRTLTDDLSLWTTGSISMLVFLGGAQSFVLLGEILDYNGVNINMKEDSQVTTIYTIVSL